MLSALNRLESMSDEIEVFLNKVDTFAEGLSDTEQAMLAHLVSDDAEGDDVAGFSFGARPLRLRELAPAKVIRLQSDFLSSGHTGNYTDPGRVTYTDEINSTE